MQFIASLSWGQIRTQRVLKPRKMLPNDPEVIWNQFSAMMIARACAAQVARSTAKYGNGHNSFKNAPLELSFGPTDSGRPFLIRDVGLRIAFQTRKLSNGPKN